MVVLKVEHEDLELVVECNSLYGAFSKARQKQQSFFSSTSYHAENGAVFLHNFETNRLEPASAGKTYPLIFENKDYFMVITFKNKDSITGVRLSSRLREVEDKFFYREEQGFLAGTINYSNNIGKSDLTVHYLKAGKPCTFTFIFEVFPTKLDFRSDYDTIVQAIDREYPHLVLDFLKKTYSTFKAGNSPNTDLIWWQIFGGLYPELIKASKFILNKPHSRIVKETRYVKADRITKWTPALEEQFSQFRKLPEKTYRSEHQALSSNTSENQFVRHAVIQTQRKYKKLKSFILRKYASNVSASFREELGAIEKQLDTISMHPFFRTVGEFKGLRQESLVLQKATGYSTVYNSWILLSSGLKFLDGIQKIELKNIADLYQIWCFLELKGVLQKLLKKEHPDLVELAEIQVDDFVFSIVKGVKSRVSFIRENGDVVDLFHDLSYRSTDTDVKSYTVNQRPDIVLRITKSDLKDNYAMTYLYDAKYRLHSDDKEGIPDFPPEDAINQMHRYRDAIYYVNKEQKPEKEVIGAYVLFPGSGDHEAIRKAGYQQSIGEVNIGAFPLRPNDTENRKLLEQHLAMTLGIDTESVLNDVSPHKDTVYEAANPLVLIGFVPENHAVCFEGSESPFYFSGERKPTRFGIGHLKYFAPYLKGAGVNAYYEILDYAIEPRNRIFAARHVLYKNDPGERLVIRLGRKYVIGDGTFLKLSDGRIGKDFPYSYTKLNELRNPAGSIRTLKSPVRKAKS